MRLHILLRRNGVTINRKKIQRLYCEEGLTVRRRKGRRCAVVAQAPVPVSALPNQRWSLDFGHELTDLAAALVVGLRHFSSARCPNTVKAFKSPALKRSPICKVLFLAKTRTR
jgi:transposase InsO family protein